MCDVGMWCRASHSRGSLLAGHSGKECNAASSSGTNGRAPGRQMITDRSNPDARITVDATLVAIAVVCAGAGVVYLEHWAPLY